MIMVVNERFEVRIERGGQQSKEECLFYGSSAATKLERLQITRASNRDDYGRRL